jgi:hypothetical protein
MQDEKQASAAKAYADFLGLVCWLTPVTFTAIDISLAQNRRLQPVRRDSCWTPMGCAGAPDLPRRGAAREFPAPKPSATTKATANQPNVNKPGPGSRLR